MKYVSTMGTTRNSFSFNYSLIVEFTESGILLVCNDNIQCNGFVFVGELSREPIFTLGMKFIL